MGRARPLRTVATISGLHKAANASGPRGSKKRVHVDTRQFEKALTN